MEASFPPDPDLQEAQAQPRQHRALAAHKAEALEALRRHPGWQLYSGALSERRARLVDEMQACLRRGDTMGALVKSIQADVLGDCMDLVRLEIADAEFTLSVDEPAMAEALRRERPAPKGA